MKKPMTLIIIHRHPRVLLGMKKRGFGAGRWNGFGGKVVGDETIEEAARRELREEAGIDVGMKDSKNGDLQKMGIMEFEFQGNPELLEVHIFKAEAFTGEPTESEEMKPQWFNVDEIPFDQMWPDDSYWLPLFLAGKKFKGKFLFGAGDAVLEHEVKEVAAF